ncbi:MAG: hypothetical protein GY757_45990, partial [bacterium]|nr:hypothetical protein [bacterium]
TGAVCSDPPLPWTRIASHGVGGLWAVGFGKGTDFLLVVSSSGRGVFDCCTGEKVARDDDDDAYDDIALEALGIGPLEDELVGMSGLEGGGLPTGTDDGWQVDRFTLEWPIESLVITPPGSSVFGVLYGKTHEFTKVYEDSAIRAWGFSPTGKTFVLATSSDVTIYGRERTS